MGEPELFSPRVHRIDVENGPNRVLKIAFEMVNPFRNPLTGLHIWTRVRAMDGNVLVAEGDFAKPWRGEPPSLYVYPYNSRILFDLYLPFSDAVLADIEAHRQGKDMSLEFSGEVTYSFAHMDPPSRGHYFMGEPRWIPLTPHGMAITHAIPQSEWLKLMAQMRWQDYKTLEIPRNSNAKIARAYKQLEEASTHYRNGRWDTCMFHCKKAYEAAMRDASGEDDLKKAAAVVLKNQPGEKGEKLNDLLLALGEYTHLARHEGKNPVSLDRFDAAQCLFMTTAAVDFIANQ